MLDAKSGDILYKDLVAATDENAKPKKYMNQPQLALLDAGRVTLMYIQSDGAGKNNNNKGANLDHWKVFQPNDQAFQELDHINNVGPYQTHSTICSGKWGVDGKVSVAAFDGPITGVGQPGLQFVNFNVTAGKFDPVDKFGQLWVAGFHADS